MSKGIPIDRHSKGRLQGGGSSVAMTRRPSRLRHHVNMGRHLYNVLASYVFEAELPLGDLPLKNHGPHVLRLSAASVVRGKVGAARPRPAIRRAFLWLWMVDPNNITLHVVIDLQAVPLELAVQQLHGRKDLDRPRGRLVVDVLGPAVLDRTVAWLCKHAQQARLREKRTRAVGGEGGIPLAPPLPELGTFQPCLPPRPNGSAP
mmetsp:Transcript_42887/g.101820  ORF Transcript_42887/g.101820 Transcript_42887/m.101820 type:complete len:204 (+) Transcript_42887:1323-1934(+)